MKKPTFRNWHRPAYWYRAKPQDLNFVMPRKDGNCLEIKATSKDGQEIIFNLDEELTKLFLLHLDKSYFGKKVTREMYGLPKV
jgi:hypothetical protein